MTAITRTQISIASSFGSGLLPAVKRVGRTVARLHTAWVNRRGLSMLARIDDRGLADIGLSRSDVRDALSQPWWNDPTAMLDHRRGERRTSRAHDLERTTQWLRLHG